MSDDVTQSVEMYWTRFGEPDFEAAASLRVEVFVGEQGVPVELEVDEIDASCDHLVVTLGDAVIGTARLVAPTDGAAVAHVGRVAVARDQRRRGIGALLIAEIECTTAQRGWGAVELAAQLDAVPFYEKLGYIARGPVFYDAGLQHRTMKKVVEPVTER